MSGNVWEWVWDKYGPYRKKSAVDPKGASGSKNRVGRGGDWSSKAWGARVSYRGDDDPSKGFGGLGFRCVRTADSN